jgi:arsenate reductase
MDRKPKVAFICVHNSCRSQMAEAIAKHYAKDIFNSYSAGTEQVPRINQDAVRLIKDIYLVDMEIDQYPKLLHEIPDVDIVIKMGCNVICPILPNQYEEDWGLDDPSGKSDDEFKIIIDKIDLYVNELARKIVNNEIKIKK